MTNLNSNFILQSQYPFYMLAKEWECMCMCMLLCMCVLLCEPSWCVRMCRTIRDVLIWKWGSHSRTHLGYEYMWKPRAQTDSSMWLLNWPSVFQSSLCAYVWCMCAWCICTYTCLFVFVVLLKHSNCGQWYFHLLKLKQNLCGLSIENGFTKRYRND